MYIKNEQYPGLAVTRSLGDDLAKSVGVISEPEIIVKKTKDCGTFVVLASDGVWEFIENEEIGNLIINEGEHDIEKWSRNIVNTARNRWTKLGHGTVDDITCVVLHL